YALARAPRFTLFPYTTLFRSGTKWRRSRSACSQAGKRASSPRATLVNATTRSSPAMRTSKSSMVLISGFDPVVRRFLRDHHVVRSEEHTSELQSQSNLVCRLL